MVNINDYLNFKIILIAIILIVTFTTFIGGTTPIGPFVLFAGIMVGIVESDNKTRIFVNAFISTLVGTLISTILSMIVVYYTESPLFAIALIQNSLILILLYLVLGLSGGLVGYYVVEEINNNRR